MNPAESVVQGTLQPDGTLHLDEPPKVPAGRVEVIVRQAIEPTKNQDPLRPGWLVALEQIGQDRIARGHQPRTREEVDAELQEIRYGCNCDDAIANTPAVADRSDGGDGFS